MFYVVQIYDLFILFKYHFYLGMNPNDLASLLSSVGTGGGAPGLMQGSHRGRVLPGTSTQPAASLLDPFGQQTPDSRPNTAPAGTRSTSSATATSTNRSSGTSSKPRNAGTSSSPSTAPAPATAPAPKSGGPKGGPIQMSALSNILANLSERPGGQDTSGAAAKPAIDLYDIMNTEVS